MKISLLAHFILAYAAAGDVTGNLNLWDDIFAARDYEVIVDATANGLLWTEGPLLTDDDGGSYDGILLFSDTISAITYSLDVYKTIQAVKTHTTANRNGATDDNNTKNKHLRVVKERSGDSPQADDIWRAEPGGNGLAVLTQTPRTLVIICQHGAQRLAILDVEKGRTHEIASEYDGKKFNGPNDVVIRSESGGLFAYFTDPVYAWLEKDRFEDLPYLDERVKSHGPGHCGVYRVKVTRDEHDTKHDVELITSDMIRPNGIGFIGDKLIVSDCCQGFHLEGCKSGTSRWMIFEQQEQENTSSSWVHSETIEDIVPADVAVGGCADGFAVYEYVNREEIRKTVLLSSCFGGLCVVDLESGAVVSRMWTAREEGGCRISNVAVGKDYAFLTGSCGILILPLTESKIDGDEL